MKEFDEIDELYGSAFKDFEVTPPADLKSAIDRELFPQDNGKGGRKGGFWYFGVGILMLVTFLSVNLKIRLEDKLTVAERIGVEVSTDYKVQEANTSEVVAAQSGSQDGMVTGAVSGTEKKASGSGESLTKAQDHEPSGTSGQSNKNAKTKGTKVKNTGGNSADNGYFIIDANDPEWLESQKQKVLVNEQPNSDELNIASAETKTEEKASFADSAAANTVAETKVSEESQDGPEDNELPVNATKKTMGSWMQVYGGIGFGMNDMAMASNGLDVRRSSLPWMAGLEYTYGFNERIGLSAGLGISQLEENLRFYSLVQDSTFVSTTIDSVWNDQTQQYDSIFVDVYEYFNVETVQANNIRFNSIELPLYATWMLNKESRYDISVAAGVNLSYNWMKALDGNQLSDLVQVNTIGLKVMLRPQFVYYFGRFGLGAYVKYSSALIPVMEYSGIKRNIHQLRGGILLRISL